MKKLQSFFSHKQTEKKAKVVIGIGTLLVGYLLFPYPQDTLPSLSRRTIRIYDRHKLLLMEISPSQGGFSSFVPLNEVPQTFINLLLFSEDKRFFTHKGVSFPAMIRALFQNIRYGKIVSGGSTITQQLVRIRKGETTVPDLYQEWAASHNIKTTDTSFAIIFPTRDAVFGIDRSMPLENQCIPLEVRGGDETTTWYDNGTFIGKGKHLFYQLSPGEHILVAEWKTIRDQVRILVIDE